MKKEIPIGGVVKLLYIWRPESVPLDAYREELKRHVFVVSRHDNIDLTNEDEYLPYLDGLIIADEHRRGVTLVELREFLFLAQRPFDAVVLIVPEGTDEADLRDMLHAVNDTCASFIPSPAWTNEMARLTGLSGHYEYAAIHAALTIAENEGELVLGHQDGDGQVVFESNKRPLIERAIAIAEELDIGTEAHLMFARLEAELMGICAVDWEAERLESHPGNTLPAHESAGLLRGTDMAATQ